MKKMKKKSIWKAGSAALAGILTVAMLAGIFSNDKVALAAEKISDLDTTMKYTESLGNNASTEYSGRVWSDKSVYSDEKVNFELFGGDKAEIINDSDFLVAFSTLATSEAVQGETTAPVDVVFVIDVSGSMRENMNNDRSRIYNTVQALNTSIETVLGMNEYTRIGVVAFSGWNSQGDYAQQAISMPGAVTLLPLDRYTKVDKNTAFFSVENNVVHTNAVNSAGDPVPEKRTSVSGGTNIQMGLYQGLHMLATEKTTTATIEGTVVKRVPSLILLSDGAPTYSSTSPSWYSPLNNSNHGDGSTAYYGNGMKAMMTGAYMKASVDRKYGVAGTPSRTRIYTIGMGLQGLDEGNEKNLASITLNPAENWSKNNTMANSIRRAWSSYSDGESPSIQINGGNSNYSLGHPNMNDVTSIRDYVDAYYSADDANSVTNVFETIVANISLATPQVPTEMSTDNPLTDGYITYVDPIGKYMTVKDVKSILYAGGNYTVKTKKTEGNKTTYVFTEEVHSVVYGNQSLANIIIEVTGVGTDNEVMTIMVPASVIPLRVNTVALNKDDSVKSHTNNGAYPMRVLYTVGLQPELVTDDGIIDTDKLSADYIKANSNSDGTINFYSNLYTGTKVINGSKAGDAYVRFDPAPTNKFYYMQTPVSLYEDKELTKLATDPNGLDPKKLYYYPETHYEGNDVVTKLTARTGAQLTNNVKLEYVKGHWQRPKGSPRVNRVLEFEGTKRLNQTSTAEDFYAPSFVYAEGSTDPYEGHYEVYLGNNGILKAPASGAIEISKKVTAGLGLTAPEKEFTFTVNFNGNDTLEGTYPYTVTASGTEVAVGEIADGGEIILKAGQSARVTGLPNGTTYTVTEAKVEGFTTTVNKTETDTVSGTVKAGTTETLDFTNNYTVEPATVGNFGAGHKILRGRDWKDTDSFVFVLTADNPDTTPMPKKSEVKVTKEDLEGEKALFNFGEIIYRQPGTYGYTITERVDDLIGFKYSAAQYSVVVTVTDNGNGTLSTSTEMFKKVDHAGEQLFDDANPNGILVTEAGAEFINTYNAKEAAYGQEVHKNFIDRTNGGHPLTDGMFQFKLKAVGDAPMPANAQGNVIYAHNVGVTAIFDQITYTQDMAGNSYKYKISEVIPDDATKNADDTYSYQGMTYDGSEHETEIKVSLDESTGEALVKIEVFYDGKPAKSENKEERYVTFNNEYKPEPAKVAFSGTKTLVGRDMLESDSFEFVLAPKDDKTSLAVEENIVKMGNHVTTVTKDNERDSETNAFKFKFEDVTFTQPGTYVFDITEKAGKAGGVTYDGHTATVTVTVTDNNGVLIATPVYSEPDFTNTYTATFDDSTAVNLDGTKELTGQTLEENEFYFRVTDVAAETSALYPNKADGSVTLLNNVTYTKEGTYTYMIQEQITESKRGGMTYDTTLFRYKVVVKDNHKGRLYVYSKTLEKSEDAGESFTVVEIPEGATTAMPVFRNVYVPTPITTTIPKISKVLAGYRSQALQAGEFEFELELVSPDPTGVTLPAVTTATNAADGSITFGALTFSKAGTYTVKITERVPEDTAKRPGVTYSEQGILVTYVVTDDQNGKLTANLYNVTGGSVFTNTYESEAKLEILVKKDFTGRENGEWLDTDVFAFELFVTDATTKAEVEAKNIILPENAKEITITKKTQGSPATFGEITFKKAGTYFFRIHEKPGTIKGVTYDTAPRDVKVVVTDDSEGHMEAKITEGAGEDNTVTFQNKYEYGTATLTGHENLKVTKNFTGRADDKIINPEEVADEWLDSDSFTFVLEAGDTDTATAVTSGDVLLPTEDTNGDELPIRKTTLVVTKENKDNAHFGDITFKRRGTYKFKVTEVLPEGATRNENGTYTYKGITYDATPRIVEVEVVDNQDGTLSAILTAQSQSITFDNRYDTTPAVLEGKANLEVAKVLTDRAWKDNDVFTFELNTVNGTSAAVENGIVDLPESTKIEISGKDTDKKANFGDITFHKVGIYHFAITEAEGDIASVKYDKHVANVTVTVVDNNEGALVATASVTGEMTFTNEYSTQGTVAIEVTKAFTGRTGNTWLASDSFSFHLAVDASDAATVAAVEAKDVVLPTDTEISITNGYEGYKNAFGNITINKAGTYKFIVHEHRGSIPGVTYDTDERNVTVEAVDNGDGTMTVTYVVEGDKTLTFSNVYKRQPANLVGATDLVVKKDFTGRANNQWLEDDKFTFKLEGANDLTIDAIKKETVKLPTECVLEVTAQNKDNAYFGDIVFKEPGVYSFKVTELLPEGASPNEEGSVIYEGIKYDTTTKYVTVVVTDNNNGTMSVTKTEASDELVFENEYSTEPTYLTGKTDLVVTKAFTGRANDKWLETDTFTFVLAAKDVETQNAVDAGNIKLPATTLEINQKNRPTANFGDIEFKATGTYTFTVTEVLPEGKTVHEGIKYDTTTKDVTVVVTDMNNGKLQVVKVTEESDDLTFTNEYSREDAVLSGIQVTKKLTGREWFNSDEFAFTLTAVGKTAGVVGTDVILPEDATGIKAKKGAETVAFGNIVFKQPGVYTFEVKETKGEISNIKYSEDVVEVTITVTDNNKGQLEAVISNTEGSMTFENIYTPTPVTATVQGRKVLTGRDLNEEEFSFQIVKDASSPEDTPMPAQTTVKNNGEGVVAFAPMTYTKAGTYKYLITEVAGDVPGVTYDGGTVEATVVVTYNAETGILTPAVSYKKVGGTGTGFVFNNVYTTNPKGLIVEGTKKVTVSTGNTYTMAGGEFTFVVTPVTSPALAGDPIKEAYSVTNEKDGKITIIDATYTEPGTYIYSVREADGAVGGITEDSTVYTVTVDVKDNLNGELIITKSISVDSEPVDAVVFDNVYDPGQTSVSLFGRKDLETEHDIVLEAGLFKFNVTAVSGIEVVEGVETQIAKENVPMPAEKQVTHDATGVFQFGEITYLKPGTYVYEISEDAANKVPGYSYSDAKYQVTVKVTDVNGSLQAEVTGLGEETDPTVVFTNGYVPTPVTLEGNTALKGTKTLTGRDLKAGEFEFTLTATDSKAPMPTRTTVANAANGGFTFEPITFRKAGTYYYTIAEKNDGLGGVTYDSTVYTVKVVVTDKGGYLDAEVTYSAPKAGTQEQETKASAAFTNTYKAEPAHLVLRAEKALTGRDLTAGEFTFLLKNGDGEVVSETTNAADGTITFKELQFAKVGTFEYTVVEDSSAQAEGIVYDDVEYKVTVKVTDDLEGNLVAAVVDQEELLFSNQYTEPAVTAIKMQALNDGEATVKTLTAKAGDTVTYTIKLENSGDAVAKNIVLTDKVPEGLKLITGTAKGGDTVDVAEDGTITWNISKLEVGKSTEVSFQVRVPLVAEDTTWLNVATYVYSNNPNNPEDPEEPFTPEKTNEVEVIEKVPNLVAVKKQQVNMGDITDEKVTVNVGDKVTYYITLTNTGNGVADNITLTDVVPEGLEFIEGTVRGGDANDVAEDGTITWNIAQLESGKSIEVSFQVRVPLVEKDTTWTNVATYVYDNNPNNPEDPEKPSTPEETNEVEATEKVPNLIIVKKQKVNNGKVTDKKLAVNSDDKVVYYITVTNTGNGDAFGVTITDEIPEGLKFIEGSISEDGKYNDGVIKWNFDTIKAGEEVTVEFAVQVPAVEKDTTWKNVATVVYENNPQNLDYPEEPGNPDTPENPKTPIVSNEVVIQEEVVVTPGTGDTTASAMWITIAMTAAFAVVATTTYRKRKVD